MIAASLFLWDILWGTHIPRFQEEQWVVEATHIERAHRLMTIFDGIREGFRGRDVPDASESLPAATTAAAVGPDRDRTGCI
eukprot:14927590-Heterocapsa_arctica.AAC.1